MICLVELNEIKAAKWEKVIRKKVDREMFCTQIIDASRARQV